MDWILIGTGCRYSITTLVQVLIRFLEYRRQVPKAAEHTSITTRNRSLVFNNNTSASFDTFFRIQEMGSESCIKYFDYYPGTVHWYSITTLVQVLIRFSNTGYGFLYLQNILRLLPRNHSLVFCNNTSASFDTILGIQKDRFRKLHNTLRLPPGTSHWYSITTLVQVLIRN